MLSAIFGLAMSATSSFGARYSASALEGVVDHQTYTRTTADPIDRPARFYVAEVAATHMQLLDYTGANSRTIGRSLS
jgi:hypothetical protein